ncbi:MAG: acetyltransferase [Candidatus Lambdaproteobacteria bacterium]|nr:acetyltransferase [Candidatus Lambdaproteobacteria bacterium]
MERIDVFNGDADGICALHQLRLAEPAAARLVTGVKRDIRLLTRLGAVRDAALVVLDISLAENRDDLLGLLARGCHVRYFDHHFAGEIPRHPALEAHIDPAPSVCTSLIVDSVLGGVHRPWAVTAAFGDNLGESAREAAQGLGYGDAQLGELRLLGELLNYNGYGAAIEDLHYPPDELYRAVAPYAEPLAFFHEAPEARRLRAGYEADLQAATALRPLLASPAACVVRFPAEPWARRVMGVYANHLANASPRRATSIVVDNEDGSLRISVRAPKARPQGADALCRRFPTGGGRAGAAGINALDAAQLPAFLAAFEQAYAAPPA